MLNWSKGLGALGEGLLRQQAIGGVMYEQAAAKEAARISGAIKQEEQQIEALTARYSQAAEIAQAANEASMANPPEYDDKGNMVTGASEFEFASRAMAQAKSAWNDLARRTGMEIKDVPVDYEPTVNLIISSLEKDQKGTLRLLIDEAKSGKISSDSRTTINNLTKNISGADNKKGVQDALIEKLKTMDSDQYAKRESGPRLSGMGPASGISAILQNIPWEKVREFAPSPMYGAGQAGLISAADAEARAQKRNQGEKVTPLPRPIEDGLVRFGDWIRGQ